MDAKNRLIALPAVAAVVALLLMGCSSSKETPPAAETTEEVAPSAPEAEESAPEAEPEPAPETGGYETIFKEYSARLKDECPSLSMMECAELSNEGVSKMAEYMYSASGKDGQMKTYEKWSGKLMDVYMSEVQ